MKTLFTASFAVVVFAGTITSCQKTAAPETNPSVISEDEKALVKAAGFDQNWFEKTPEGSYLIEGDILLTKAQLQEYAGQKPSHNFVIANEEHYRTYNLVKTGGTVRTITVSLGSGFPTYYSTGLDQVITRYNALGLSIRFQRVASGGDIPITGRRLGTTFGGGCILGQSAGFPDAAGNPARGFTLSTSKCATNYISTANKADEVMAHEIGHCIGFRHTDYVNRISCGSGSGEAAGADGAVWISGTPQTVSGSYNSWMMACTNGDPAFNADDNYALKSVYP